ncbi:cyclin-like protein [Chytriomyces sp. MP71]|nr:cyclin-like protein [Chytriomyces sp. MP71]
MAATYLTSYIQNYFPSIAALSHNHNHPTQNSHRSDELLPSCKMEGGLTGKPNTHDLTFLPPPTLTASETSYRSQQHQQILHEQQRQAQHAFNAYTQQVPTPVLQASQSIPPAMLARFEAFEDTVSMKCLDEYAGDIDLVMREMEVITLPHVNKIDEIQSEVSWKHRKSLILWLIEVHNEYDLRPESLYLTVNLIDRVCAKRLVRKQHYQLLGLTCFWIAAKYEENHGRVPSLKTLVVLLDNQFTAGDFIVMEKLILSDLDFILGHPSAEAFLKVQCKHVGNVKPAVRALARMIMELTLIHRRFRPFRSSLLASASLILADSLQSCRMWNHTDPLLVRILTNLEECLVEAPRQIAEKYRSGKFLGISSHVKAMLNNK